MSMVVHESAVKKNTHPLLWMCLLALFFAACSSDGSTEAKCLDCEENVYASVDDLPVCMNDNSGKLSLVGEKHYVCMSSSWKAIESVVAGVCNIPACSKALEGKIVLSKSSETAYQCKSGSWKDASGKGFAEDEFVGCFLNSLILDSVDVIEDLKNCTQNREGALAVVAKNLLVCSSKNWAKVSDYVVSEANLPECKKKGDLVYVLGKMAAYQCMDGLWYRDGKAVSQPESSTSVKSSSSAEPPIDDGTKVRGVCVASLKEAAKGEEVSYSFYNLGGTIISYSWDFGAYASDATSGEASPTISYSRGGIHKAKLVLNKGLVSESDEVECTGVAVNALPVTGCLCTTSTEGLILRGDNPVEAEWSVSGCTGESPFTYNWSGGASGTGASAIGRTGIAGKYAPTVTVTNSDGGTMEPVCQTVTVMEGVRAECSILMNRFQIDRISGIADNISSIAGTLVSAGDDVSLEWPINGYQLSRWNANAYEYYYDYSITRYYKEVESGISAYAVYALVYAGDTICTATKASCAPSEIVVDNGGVVSWNLSSSDNLTATPNSYSWIFTNKSGSVISTSTLASPRFTALNYGKVKATLVLDKGLVSENELTCSDLTVADPATVLVDSRDNQTYEIVNIGSQTWMAQNLNYAENGSICPLERDSYCEKYGRLYSGPSVTLCPSGWHVPTLSDWSELIAYVDENNGSEGVGKSLKAAEGWMAEGTAVQTNHSGTRIAVAAGSNLFGFSALPAGCCWNGNCYSDDETRFWISDGEAYKVAYDSDGIKLDASVETATKVMFSVRCVKDVGQQNDEE